MKNYFLFNDRVEFRLTDGSNLAIYFNEYSGLIYWRFKIDTVSGVKHPGILLGIDNNGNRWYMHNHYQHGRPVIESEQNFAKGQPLYLADRQSGFSSRTVITNALNEIALARPYEWLSYNCQIFVNRICFRENRSESVENWVGGIAATLLLTAGITAIINSK